MHSGISLFALGCVALWGCGDNQDPAGAGRLWRAIHEDAYREWERAPGYETAQKTNAPHGDTVEIYINEIVAEALASQTAIEEWPLGSVIVKDGFDGGDLELVAVMEKQEGGWFWAEYDDEGDPDYSGRPELCIECHDSGDDLVRAFAFPDAR